MAKRNRYDDELNAAAVLAALRKGPLKTGSHAWLYEVRNQTGYARRTRTADAVVVSLWPSRGLWMAGIEVKVSRGDWLRELKDPEKTIDIQRFCDHWWVAAPPDVVKLEELPKTWGLYEVNGSGVKVKREAPKLTPDPLKLEFVASMLRNASEGTEAARRKGHSEGWDKAVQQYGGDKVQELEAKIMQLQNELSSVKQQVEWKQRDVENLKATMRDFEKNAGLEPHTLTAGTNSYRTNHDVGAYYRLAVLLKELDGKQVAERLEAAAAGIREAAALRDKVSPELQLVTGEEVG